MTSSQVEQKVRKYYFYFVLIDGKCVSTDEWCLKSYLSKFVRWTMININLKATSADGSFSRKGPFFSTSKEPPSFAIINFSNLLVVCSTHQQSSVLYHLKSCILHFSKQQEYWVVRKEGVRLSKTNTSVEMYSSVPKKGFDRSMNHLFFRWKWEKHSRSVDAKILCWWGSDISKSYGSEDWRGTHFSY